MSKTNIARNDLLLCGLFLLFLIILLLIAIVSIGAQQPGKSKILAGGCDETLWQHAYHPNRLHIQQRCVTVAGTIIDASHGKNKDGCRHEADGDGHCFLRLDAGQEKYINAKNVANEDGALVFEPMCRYRVTQQDALAACKDWKQKLALPAVGSHVRATGAWVLDAQHGHFELHPITSITATK
jgi:hypothetical protein